MELVGFPKFIDWSTKLFSWASRKYQREEQIEFLRDLLIETFRNIGNERPYADINGICAENAIPQRAARFNHLMMQLDEIVEHRIPDLHYSEVTDLRISIKNAKSMATALPRPKDDWSDCVNYSCIYRGFNKLKWLGLPAKLPWRSPPDPLEEALKSHLDPIK